jgi:hypothetical protein
VLVAAVFLASTWRPAQIELEALGARSAGSALARSGLWMALLATLAPILIARAALVLPQWRRGEVDWLLAAKRSRADLVLSTFLGLAAAAALFALFVAATAEIGAGRAGAGRALSTRFATPSQMLEDGRLVRRITLDRLPAGAVLRARLRFLGGAPAADVRFSARSTGSGAPLSSVESRISATGVLELALPAIGGPVELELERIGESALVALQENGIEIAVPTRSARSASLRVAARAWIALCAAMAIGMGLGGWLSGGAAATAALALAWVSLLAAAPGGGRWPAAALSDAIELAGEGLAAPWPAARSLALAAAIIAGSLALATSGLVHWRRAP